MGFMTSECHWLLLISGQPEILVQSEVHLMAKSISTRIQFHFGDLLFQGIKSIFRNKMAAIH